MTRCLVNVVVLMLLLTCNLTQAQVTIDGTVDSAYSLIATQTCETGFGDNASEWNAAYANVDSGRMNIVLTGNIEANFNKLEIFIDSVAGGENILSATPDYDFSPDGTFWISSNLGGLTFDSGFEADFHVFVRAGNGVMDFDFVDRLGGTVTMINSNTGQSAYGGAVGDMTTGSVDPGSPGINAAGEAIMFSIPFAHDNSNMAGVGGDQSLPANQANAEAVTTGLEFSIDVRDMGIDPAVGGVVKLCICQNGAQHDFLSNQVLGGLPGGTSNLGGDGAGNFIGNVSGVNFNDFAGDQFICVSIPPSGGSGGTQPADEFNVFRGILLSGGLSDSFDSDDNQLTFNPGFTISSKEAPVWLIFDATLAQSPSSLELVAEAQAGTPGLASTLEAFNWNTSAYDEVDVRDTSFNNDEVISADLSAGIADYVNGSNEIRARIGWRRTGFTINFPWEVRLDQLVWDFQ